jgi:coniferyl-aldehyde dehydrogenase
LRRLLAVFIGSLALSDPDNARLLLEAQRAAFRSDGIVTARVRIDRLDRALDLLVTHQAEICDAAGSDFGQRPATLTRFMDVLPAVVALKYARRHVSRWMRPKRQCVTLPAGAPGVRAEIMHDPLGVVGVISPWNFPITLSFSPLAGILAAGNRCLIKPSELTPRVSSLLQRLVGQYFDALEVAVVVGGPEVAEAFSRLPFDHLLFTGSAAVGRRVMTAAAANLVPVTLELGGKSPAVIGRSADLGRAVDRIMLHKLANAGQICLAPDYVCVPCEMVDGFVQLARAWVDRVYPSLPSNPDYSSMVSIRHAQRMQALLADAGAKGARVVALAPGLDTRAEPSRLISPALILDVTDDMQVMQEEIFGPLLPIRPYERIEESIADINSRPKPLALYYFGNDRAEMCWVLGRTISGGVTVNDIAMHFVAEELPFGGVGASGMGAYHGEHGFTRFSHARAVFYQTRLDVAGLVGLRPPYGARAQRLLKLFIRR